MKTSYNQSIVTAFFKEQGIPEPEYEYRFCPGRRWRFDLAFPEASPTGLAIEVQGAIFQYGRHNRGASLLKEWEKLNTAACLYWRILYCQPSELCTAAFANTIKRALNL